MANEMFETVVRKSYADKYGHVNYKRYLDLFRLGQDAFAKKRQLSFSEIERVYGLRSVIRHMNVEYIDQIFPLEKIVIQTRVERVGNSSFTYHQEILHGGKTATRCILTIVMVDKSGDFTTIPFEIRTKLLQKQS